jgi:hypothetical protein
VRAANARTGPAWRASAREQQQQAAGSKHGPRKFYTGPILIVIFLGIEVLLGTRIIGQATSQAPDVFPFSAVFLTTDYLVLPFRNLRPEPDWKETGIVQFATLVAFEAYLIAFLALIFLVQVVHIAAWFVRRGRRNASAKLAAVVETDVAQVGVPQPETQQAA